MKQPSRLMFLIAFFFAAALYCSADVYIAQNSLGANSGLDCADAHSAAWFNSPSNWGNATNQIGAGTTVHFCGTISTDLKAQGSGAAGKPITLFFENNASISEPVCGTCLTISNQTYIVVNGGTNGIIQNTNNGTSKGYQNNGSHGIDAANCNNCEIKNLTIQNIYVHTGSGAEIDQTSLRCIYISGNNNLIHDNVMHDAGWCIYEDGSDIGTRIYNNSLYNVDHGWIFTPGSESAPAGPVYFYNNHVHDYANWDTSSNAYHHDGIHCYTVPNGWPLAAGPPIQGAHLNGLWIYNNLFDGNIGGNVTGHIFLEPGVQTDGTATPCMDATSQVHIFGNILIGGTANGILDLGRASNHPLSVPLDFYNNTVFGTDASQNRAAVFENVNMVNARNNIVGGTNKLWDGVSFPNTDYNGYITCSTSVSYNCWPVSNGTNNYNLWRSQCACDPHGVNSQQTSGGVNQSTGALITGSVMIGSGTSMMGAVASWPTEQQNALQTDRNGTFRGSGNWDIGALSSGSTSSQPLPPTNLTATPY